MIINKSFSRILFLLCLMFSSYSVNAIEKSEPKLNLIGSGDILKITVFDHPEMTVELQVNNTGAIKFPLLGDIQVSNMTFSEAESVIENKLKTGSYILNPQVNILVEKNVSQQVSVTGEVNRPGRFSIESAMRVLDLLALSGGVTINSGDEIILIQKNTKKSLSLFDISNDPKLNIIIHPNDTLFIPKAKQIYVYGQVNRPGVFKLERNMSIMNAIAIAGGFSQIADKSDIKIQRKDDNGDVKEIDADMRSKLEADDVVYIDESMF